MFRNNNLHGVSVVGDINCLAMAVKWAKSQLNRGAWATTLLNKKSFILTISYSFWHSGKHSIQQLVLESMSQV